MKSNNLKKGPFGNNELTKKENNRFGSINPHLPNGLSHPYQLDESISNFRVVWFTFSFLSYF